MCHLCFPIVSITVTFLHRCADMTVRPMGDVVLWLVLANTMTAVHLFPPLYLPSRTVEVDFQVRQQQL